MARFTTSITKNAEKKGKDRSTTIVILSAGTGSRIKSYEPRSLLRIGNRSLIEHQINTISQCFDSPEIISVVGCGGCLREKYPDFFNLRVRGKPSRSFKQWWMSSEMIPCKITIEIAKALWKRTFSIP